MRRLVVVLALLAASAAAQPADPAPRGLYATFGNASPERLLLPTGADAVVSVGLRLSEAVDVHLGYGQASAARLIDNSRRYRQAGVPRQAGRVDALTRGLSASVGLTAASGPFVGEARASATVDRYAQTAEVETWPSDAPEAAPVRTVRDDRGSFLHGGLSATLGIEAARGRGRIRPGLGLAALASTDLGGSLPAQRARWMPYLRIPTTVALTETSSVTLDATVGIIDGGQTREGLRVFNATPVVDAGLRLDF